ncbi:MAG: hypothetical protein JXQ93_02130 [Flavobacteriaceae bacterium]
MQKIIILILFSLVILSCGKKPQLSSNFFFNNGKAYTNLLCSDSKNRTTWVYNIDSTRVIYPCYIGDLETVFNIAINKNPIDINERMYFKTVKLSPWSLTYDNKTIIAVRKDLKKRSKSLVKIDIRSKEITPLLDLSYDGSYSFSEHPLSENGVITFKSGLKNVSLYNLKTKKHEQNIFQSFSNPIISKNGEKILYVTNETIYLYNIDKETSEIVYSTKEDSSNSVFKAFFGENDNIVVAKIIKNSGIKVLERSESLIISNGKVIKKGQLNFKKGYRYY